MFLASGQVQAVGQPETGIEAIRQLPGLPAKPASLLIRNGIQSAAYFQRNI
jgi:hypothetical protein